MPAQRRAGRGLRAMTRTETCRRDRGPVLDRSKKSATVRRCAQSVDSPSVPSCPTAARRAGRARRQPALVLAPRDPGRLRARSTPTLWESTGRDPVRLLGAVGQAAARPSWRPTTSFLARLGAAARGPGGYLTGDRWYQRAGSQRRPGAPSPTSRPEFGITAVLPQYSGGLGILAGDHLKAASDLGVPIIGVGLLYRHGYFQQSLSREGWQQETYPVLDPDGLPISLLREADGDPRHDHDRPARRTAAGGPDLGRPGRPGAAADAGHRRRGQPRALRDVTDRLYGGNTEHRLRQELLLGVGGVRAIRAYTRITGAPGARGVPHQRGPRRLPRPRADPRAHRGRGRPAARLRHRARGRPRRHRLHHPHPGAGRHRPLPARPGRAVLRRRRRHPRRPGRPDPGARHRGLHGRRRRRSSTWR